MNTKKIVTRMAPSPTGKFHVGGVRTALYNYLYARQNDGTFIIRSEDTDKERSKPEHEQNMLDVFTWLGMPHDEFHRQSERTEMYQAAIHNLIESGNAYEAEPSKDNPDKAVIRFKNPREVVKFSDEILGDIEVDPSDLEDFVIARNIDTPIYHLTVVVDDADMEVTHVIRGQEHLANTARQILILEALGYERPIYAHIPLIMSPRGGKLSKRDPEVIPALDYQLQGILPGALINFLAYIGWNPGDEREIMSLDELVSEFDLKKVQKGGGIFNIDKLYWINKHYLEIMSDDEFFEFIKPELINFKQHDDHESVFRSILDIIRERISSFVDLQEMITAGDFDYYFNTPEIDAEKLVWKKDTAEGTKTHLQAIIPFIEAIEGDFNSDTVKSALWDYAEEAGKGNVLWPLRFALSGKDKSPDPFTLCEKLGKARVIERVNSAISML